MGKLKVVKAAYAGACYGVQRALDMTLKAAEAGGSVCTLGPLIHNPGVVAELEERGICVADSVDSIDADGVVIRPWMEWCLRLSTTLSSEALR